MSTFTISVTSSATNTAGTAYGQQPDLGAPSFLDMIVTNSTDLYLPNGVYDAYCLDVHAPIFLSPTTYVSTGYAGNDDTTKTYLQPPLTPYTLTQEKVDQLNWLLFQNFTADSKYVNQFCYGEVQTAIWKIVGFTPAEIIDGGYELFLSDNGRQIVSASDVEFLISAAQSAVVSGYNLLPSDAFSSMVIDPAGNAQPLMTQLQSAKLGNYVWLDADKDGVQDAGESGVNGVTVKLYDGAGNLITSTTTGDDYSTAATEQGYYQFTGLKAGSYKVEVIAPKNYAFTKSNATTDAIDSDVDEDGITQVITLVAGESNQTIDAGLIESRDEQNSLPASLSGYVYQDEGNDGVWDGVAAGIGNVTVTLLDASGNPVIGVNGNPITTTTDENGFYEFIDLKPGTYGVSETQPSTYLDGKDTAGVPGTGSAGNDIITGIALTEGQSSRNNNFGELKPASVSGFVYVDNSDDGIKDGGEPGISGVTVTLTGTDDLGAPVSLTTTTIADGSYSFDDLRPGIYTVTEAGQPAHYLDGKDTAGVPGSGVAGNDVINNIILNAGDSSTNNNFGELPPPAQLSGYVYVDTDNDGNKDAGENPLAGIIVNLTGTDILGRAVSKTATTDGNGFYQFTDLAAGIYSVTEPTQPNGYLDGQDTVGSTGGSNGVNDTLSGIVLAAGDDSKGNNFGELPPPAQLSGYVYVDTDNDGNKDAGENPLAGIIVNLTGTDTLGRAVNKTATTDGNGFYQFTNLVAGTYSVTEPTQPNGYLDGQDTAGSTGGSNGVNETLSGIVLAAGDDSKGNNFGELPPPAQLSGYVYVDTDNDGNKDAGENPLAGIIVNLTGTDTLGRAVSKTATTDGNGFYQFTDLAAGTYTVTEPNQPNGYLDGQDSVGSTGGNNSVNETLSGIVLAAGANSQNNNFGELPPPAQLSGYVYVDTDNDGIKDAGENPLAGIIVNLTGTDTLGRPVSKTATTDGNGFYQFTDLVAGTYSVTEPTQPNGYLDGQDTAGSTGGSNGVNETLSGIVLAAGANSQNNNFGELPPPAQLSGYVYVDTDNDGIKDAGENPLAGIIVNLNGTDTLGRAVSKTATTDGNGFYQFTNLAAGIYTVTEPTQPNGYLDGQDTVGSTGGSNGVNDTLSGIVLAAGANSENNNFGELPPPAQLSGYVYVDTDNDGIKDAGENPLAGVVVNLTGTDTLGRAVSKTATTDGNGFYQFTDLAAGTYTVTEPNQPNGYLDGQDSVGSTGGNNSVNETLSGIVLAAGANSQNNNFGELPLPPVNVGVDIEKYVRGSYETTTSGGGTEGFSPGFWKNHACSADLKDWEATGYTKNDSVADVFGIDACGTLLDALSAGGGGVNALLRQSVAGLLNASNPNIDYEYTVAEVIQMTQTAVSTGNYSATQSLLETENSQEGDWDTPATGGSSTTVETPNDDADTAPGISLELGNTAIFTYVVTNTGAVELNAVQVTDDKIATLDFIGGDIDGDNKLDVTETWTYSARETVTTTGLHTNIGTVTAEGAGKTVDDTDKANYTVTTVTPPPPANNASLGDKVWLDKDGDGKQDSDEAGVAGVTVTLIGGGADGLIRTTSDNTTQTMVTDANGNYSFIGLAAGQYQVDFEAGTGYALTRRNAGSDDAKDSDADRTTGLSQVVTLAAGATNNTIDAGLTATCPPPANNASIGDKVWLDKDGDGKQDSDEAGVAGVTVTLIGGGADGLIRTTSDNTTQTMVTDANGNYSFTGLAAGQYQVDFEAGTGYALTQQNAGRDDAIDSDADRTTGLSQVVTLAAGATNNTIDAGLTATCPPPVNNASVGDKVWDDMNHNNIQDASEPGIANIRITLTGAGVDGVFSTGDDIIKTTTTNTSGNYLFSNLAAGDYKLTFDKGGVMHYNYGAWYNMSNWKWAVKDAYSNSKDTLDSDVAGDAKATTDITTTSVFTLAAGQNDMTKDAGITPIVIDLNGDGIHTVARTDLSATFDLFGNGTAIKSGWLSGDDGFLAIDRNGNGKIDDISELFGGLKKGDGFAKLSSFDSNKSGTVDAADVDFANLSIWRDINGNHATDDGELFSLAAAGVVSLKTSFTETPFLDLQGNVLLERSSATLANAQKVDMTDVYFNVSAADAAAAGIEVTGLYSLLGY
ncbi:hypothetical protein CKO12_03440 [Chromatium okenii]|uniref:SdrD B-like domain-containing protein n=1 Tax=Chromatium okenii TaxID=61644 RepID=UPI001902FFA1|nr:SdrD B-like domain-containing protein [Chromatium okenii]MBK1640945.1 hypothetical protein [Chromatium okenii]